MLAVVLDVVLERLVVEVCRSNGGVVLVVLGGVECEVGVGV